MTYPQPGIFSQGTRAHYHLEFDMTPGVGTPDIRAAIAQLAEPSVTVGGFNLVIGLGPALWRLLEPSMSPPGFHDFTPIGGSHGHGVPATQHDLWVWTHGTGPDLALDVARAITRRLSKVAMLALELPGFVYRDSRDLTGFIDGTAILPLATCPE